MNRSKVRDQRFWKKWRKSGAVSAVVAARTVSLKDMRPKEAYNEFLYPISRQFPVDEVCGQIVRELEKRNWQVPGIVVDFHDYGTGAQKFRMVSNIRGEEFRLHFGRSQRLLPGGHYNDIAAVTTIAIPKKKIDIHNDESGPSFCLYVGDKWERDRKQFMDSFNIHAKLDRKPKMYLKYTGGCDCRSTAGASFEAIGLLTAIIDRDAKRLSQMRHTHSGRRSPLLVHTNDLGRDYDPEGNEPRFFRTADVLEEFRQYLEKVVLKSIVSSPIPESTVDISTPVAAIPFSSLAILGDLFTFGEWRDEERIRKGKENPEQLEMSDRFGMEGGGYRLMSLGTPNDGTVPEIAYDGFLWCGIAPTSVMVSIKDLDIPGHYRWSDREQYVIRIKPKKANDIYIADHAPYEKRRKEIWDTVKEGRERLTDAEVADFTRARARSIIPISKYRGGFEQPVVLINRELDLDEVEVVSGPHREKQIA